jgi:hypothetical protein
LYIITDKNLNKSGQENPRLYSGIFISFLKEQGYWDADQNEYEFGFDHKQSPKAEKISKAEIQNRFISTPWKDHNMNLLASSSQLWGAETASISYGDLVREIMVQIRTVEDVETVIENFQNSGILDRKHAQKVATLIQELVSHQKLAAHFSTKAKVYNQREIQGANGQSITPDRLVIHSNNKVTLIHYTNGEITEAHNQQLLSHAQVLESVGYAVEKKIVVSINETLLVEEF